MTEIARLQAKITADTRHFEVGMKRVASKLTIISAKMATAGKAMTKALTLPLLAVGGAAILMADRMDKAMRDIRVATGATGKQLEGMGDVLRGLLGTITTDTKTASAVIGVFNTHLGITGDQLQGISRQLIEFSHLMGEDAAKNADSFARVLRGANLTVEEGNILLDKMLKIAMDTGIGFGALNRALIKFSPVMRLAGFNTAETAELFGRLHSVGLDVRRVMPGINAALRRWSEEGKDARTELGHLIETIRTAETQTEALAIATEIFGAEGAVRMTIAIRDGIFAIDDLGVTLEGTEGLIKRTADETRTFGEKLGILADRAGMALIPLGDLLIDFIDQAIPRLERIIKLAEMLGERFSRLSDRTKGFVINLGLFLAIAGPTVYILSKMITMTMSLVKGIGKLLGLTLAAWLGKATTAALGLKGAFLLLLKTAIVPALIAFGKVIAVVTGLTLAGWFLIEQWNAVKEGFKAVWGKIKTMAKMSALAVQLVWARTMDFIRDEITEFIKRLAVFRHLPGGIGIAFEILMRATSSWAERSEDQVESLRQEYRKYMDELLGYTRVIDRPLVNFWGSIRDAIATTLDQMKALVGITGEEMPEALAIQEEAFVGLKETIEESMAGIPAAMDEITTYIDRFSAEREAVETEWTDRLFRLTAERIEIIRREYEEAIAQAEALGADTVNIHAYYQERLTREKERAAEEERRLQQQITDRRLAIEKDWSDRLFRLNADRLEIMRRAYADALIEAEKYGADVTAIHAYWQQRITEEEKKGIAERERLVQRQPTFERWGGVIARGAGMIWQGLGDVLAIGFRGVTAAITGNIVGMVSAILDLVGKIVNWIREAMAQLRAAFFTLAQAAWNVAEAFGDLVMQADSLAAIQRALSGIQQMILSMFLAFLWPIATILEDILGLFRGEQKRLARGFGMPIGWRVERIRYAAATPGEPPIRGRGDRPGWIARILKPFREAIKEALKPFRSLIEALKKLGKAVAPAVTDAFVAILETFSKALDGVADWIRKTLMPDLIASFQGFSRWWRGEMDPFLRAQVFPVLGRWLEAIYSFIRDKLIPFLEANLLPSLKRLWEAVQPLVETLGQKLLQLWDVITKHWDTILKMVDLWLRQIMDKWIGRTELATAFILAESGDLFGALRVIWESGSLSLWDKLKFSFAVGASALWKGLMGVFRLLGNALIGLINAIIWVVNLIPLVNIPFLPYLEKGGYIMQSGLAYVHAGEMVMPAQTKPLSQGPTTINIHVGEERIANVVLRELKSINLRDTGYGLVPLP